jgi:hypothetical protein
MPASASFDYALIRVVPRVERGEFINAGVILFCRVQRFLGASIDLDRELLRAMAPDLDIDVVVAHLAAIPLLCEGGAAAGPLGGLDMAARFHWLVAARSTVIQTSPVHCGVCDRADAALRHLTQSLVRRSSG